jgi:hypothetical protein
VKGFDVRVHGSGVVARQEPVSQTGVAPGSAIHLHLAPPDSAEGGTVPAGVDEAVLSELRSGSKSPGEATPMLARAGEQP